MTNNNRIYRRDQLRFLTADVNRILAKAREIEKDFPDGDQNGDQNGAKEDLGLAIQHLDKAFYHLNWTLAGEMDPWD